MCLKCLKICLNSGSGSYLVSNDADTLELLHDGILFGRILSSLHLHPQKKITFFFWPSPKKHMAELFERVVVGVSPVASLQESLAEELPDGSAVFRSWQPYGAARARTAGECC